MSLLRARRGPFTEEIERARAARPEHVATAVCGFCSTGCGLDVQKVGGALRVTPTRDYPVNRGMACPKGWEALAPLAAPDRATHPLLRVRGRLAPVSWEQAIDTFTTRLRALPPESIALLSSGQITSEEMLTLGAVARFGMGIAHADSNTRQCMATSVTAYKETFGFDAPPYTYADLEESDVIVLWGSNLCIAHPILWQRIAHNRHRPTIVAVDPRATETAMASTRHLPLRPKSDLALALGILRELIAHDWIDRRFVDAHTTGFDELCAQAAPWTLARTATATGLAVAAIADLAHTIHRGRRVSLWWTMGVNQSHEGVRTAQAIIAIALVTGNIGRPGTGPNSVTGQCNAMGSRQFSNTSSLYCGRDFANAAHRAEVATVFGIDPARVPSAPGRAYDQIVDGVLAGAIRALWVVGTNPLHSWINQGVFEDVLARLDFLVVQDMYASTETARRADLVLPAAGWGEKDGTFINSERRIGRVRKVAEPPGEALPDLEIAQRIAQAWGCGDLVRDPFDLMKRLSAGRPCDITGIRDPAMLDEQGGIQWPFPAGAPVPARERRLFADGRFFTPDGRARLIGAAPQPLPESTSSRYPFLLLTGRGNSSQWHTDTRTGKSAMLRALSPQRLYVEVNPADARRLAIAPDQPVKVASRRGSLIARAFVTTRVRPGEVFVPMHFPETNRLTVSAFDPYSRQPAYKASAVNLERPEPWELTAT